MDYDDGLIACPDDELVIRRYDLFLRPKRIPYAEIRGVRRLELGRARRWRLWGTADPRLWFNLYPGRRHKRHALVVDVGPRIEPVITPDDVERVAAVLRGHGVAVASG